MIYLMITCWWFQNNLEVLARYQDQFQNIFIDDCQNENPIQNK